MSKTLAFWLLVIGTPLAAGLVVVILRILVVLWLAVVERENDLF